jgi:predicted kinase
VPLAAAVTAPAGGPVAAASDSTADGLRLVVLVGLPGSGKSTLAAQLAAAGWAVVSQDELGSRRACESRTEKELQAGGRVAVDRTNIDVGQRAHWTAAAARCGVPATATACVLLEEPLGTCLRRVAARRDHPTLPPGPRSAGVVRSFAAQLERPGEGEGFGSIFVIGPGGAGMNAVLDQLIGPGRFGGRKDLFSII